MTPEEMAGIHRSAFSSARSWGADEFRSLCQSPHVLQFTEQSGFALVRVIAGEAELLTLAVSADQRRRGTGDRLMLAWMQHVPAEIAFLEVAEDNLAALALYAKHGFATVGRRKSYYARRDMPAVDALLMQAALSRR